MKRKIFVPLLIITLLLSSTTFASEVPKNEDDIPRVFAIKTTTYAINADDIPRVFSVTTTGQ